MMRFEGSDVMKMFKLVFGLAEITPDQMRWLIRVAKHIRGRCRSNAALKNYLARSFADLKFGEVEREWKGKKYMALTIATKAKPQAIVVDEDEGEEGGAE